MRNSLRWIRAAALLSLLMPLYGQPTCAPKIAPAKLKGQRPLEVIQGPPGTCGFVQFSWQDFLSLSWPALPVDPNNKTSVARALPDTNKIIGQDGDNPTVWEQYQPNWYLFQPNNPPPQASAGNSFAGWNQYAALPAACGPQNVSPPPRILSSLSKFDAMPGVAQAFSAPLIDQNGYYARYEIALDYVGFNFVNANQFYLLSSVEKFAQANQGKGFEFPNQSGNTPGSTPGTTFVKAAWKTLSAAEINSGRFHTAQAFLFTPAASSGGLTSTCAGPVTVGLVGLHIVHRTSDFGNYVWETFEQVDNTPADPSNPGPTPPQGWSFFKPGSNVIPNQQPKCPNPLPGGGCDYQPTSSHLNDATGGPTQALRLNPISKSPNNDDGHPLDQINSAAQAALKAINPNSVWQYYQLVDVQWQVPSKNQKCYAIPSPPPPASPFFPPDNVANMTMETYHQNATQSKSNSCMTCHRGASVPFKDPTGPKPICADLTFELTLAWAPTVLPAARVPGLNSTSKRSPATKKGGKQ